VDDGTTEISGCAHLGLVSVGASLLGSALAASIVAMTEIDEAHAVLFAIPLIFFFGMFIAVPAGLILGIPMLAIARPVLPRRTVLVTPVFGLVGLLGGIAIERLDGASGFGLSFAIFGACVGAMHPLVYNRANGAGWRTIATAVLVSAIAVPAAAWAGESIADMRESRLQFEEFCADRYGSMAVVADKAALKRWNSPPGVGQGKWYKQGGQSVYASERWIPLDDARFLIARDYAYVPSGFAGWITGGRRVERHCLSEKRGGTASMLRRYGFGMRPTLSDLEN
jgi:hypothetical protein